MVEVEGKEANCDRRAFEPWLIWFYLHNHMICRFKAECPHGGKIRFQGLEAPPRLSNLIHTRYSGVLF